MGDGKKLLIVGGSSYVGRHLFQALGSDRAIATYNNTPLVGGVSFDSLTMSLAEIVADSAEVSHAIILMGDTNPETCAADLDRSCVLNVDSIERLLLELKGWGIKPIFTSSEFVFDGERGNYREEDLARPILVYGEQKLAVERFVIEHFDDYVIVRLAKVFGDELGDGTLFTGWLDSIEPGKTQRCASDQRFSPVFVGDVVRVLVRFTEIDANGLFHLGGPTGHSRLELLQMLLAEMGKHADVEVPIEPCSIHDFQLQEKRPVDVTMDPAKLMRVTGIELSDTRALCGRIAAAWYNRLKGS